MGAVVSNFDLLSFVLVSSFVIHKHDNLKHAIIVSPMPTETTVDAEDLKSRVRELRRFL